GDSSHERPDGVPHLLLHQIANDCQQTLLPRHPIILPRRQIHERSLTASVPREWVGWTDCSEALHNGGASKIAASVGRQVNRKWPRRDRSFELKPIPRSARCARTAARAYRPKWAMPIRSMRKIVPSGGKRGASSASRTGVLGCSRPVPSVIRLAGARRALFTDPRRSPPQNVARERAPWYRPWRRFECRERPSLAKIPAVDLAYALNRLIQE